MKKAFTIIEVLVVVAIIAILLAIMIPVFNGGIAVGKSEFEGCVNPRVIGTTPGREPISGHTQTEYLYECEDKRQIASTTRPQDLNLNWK